MLCTLSRPCPQEFRCHSQVLFEQPRGVKASLDDMSEALGPLLLGPVLLLSLLLPPGSSGHRTHGQRPVPAQQSRNGKEGPAPVSLESS